MTLVSIGFGALSPTLHEIQAEFGVGASFGALLVSGFGVGRLLVAVPTGLLVDRIGAGRVVLVGVGIFVVGSAIGAVSSSMSILVLGRFLQGTGCAVVPAGVLAQLMTNSRAEKAGGAMALYQSGLAAGGALGPAVAGPVAAIFGWRSAWVVCAVAGLLALACALPGGRAPVGRTAPRPEVGGRGGWLVWLAVVAVMLPNAVAALDRFALNSFLLPLYATGPAGFDTASTGVLLGAQIAMALALLGPSGWASNRFGIRSVVVAAALVVFGMIAAMPLVPTPAGLWVVALLYGAGLSALGVAGGLLVFTIKGHSMGTLVSIYRVGTDAVQVVGPIVVGGILDIYGYQAAFFSVAAFGLSALACLLVRPGARPG